MNKLNRKFLILGQRRVGKSRFIQQVYDELVKDPKFPNKPAEWDHEKHDFVLPDAYDDHNK